MAVEPSFFVRFGLFEKGWTGFEFQVHKGSNCTFYLGANGEEQQNFTNICLGFEKNNCKVTMVHTVRKAVKMTRYCSRLSLMIHDF